MAKAIITIVDVGDSCAMTFDFPNTDSGGREECLHSLAVEKAVRIMNEAFGDSGIHLHVTATGYVISGAQGSSRKLPDIPPPPPPPEPRKRGSI